MKLRFYVDLWPGLDPMRYGLNATTQPPVKTDGWRRLAFDVAIPDNLLYEIDAIAPEVSRPEVVEGHEG
jgi:hypothetical protein